MCVCVCVCVRARARACVCMYVCDHARACLKGGHNTGESVATDTHIHTCSSAFYKLLIILKAGASICHNQHPQNESFSLQDYQLILTEMNRH